MNQRGRNMQAMAGLLLLLLVGFGCAEPNRNITGTTADEAYEVRLKARKNHLKPGETLPIWVEVERLAGQPVSTHRDTVEFVTNQGNVSPSRLVFTLVGQDDSLTAGPTTQIGEWVSFTLDSRPDEQTQAEVHALFRDLDALLKIRIVQ